MIAPTIFDNIILALQNDSTLSKYIKNVYYGLRNPETIDAQSMPCIMVEPIDDGEIEKDTNNVQDIYLSVGIYALSTNNYNDFNKTIVGDTDYKGVLDINNDIRVCLINNYNLSGTVIDTRVGTTRFSPPDFNFKYPIRGLSMPVKILYRQVDGV